MRIRYENTIDDLIAFGRHHGRKSHHFKGAQRKRKWLMIGAVVVPVLVIALAIDSTELRILLFIFAVLFVVLASGVIPQSMARASERQVRSMYAEGRNKTIFCEHELELTGEGIVERHPYGESRTTWEGIERINSTGGYTFIYTSALSAHIIPRNSVVEGDYRRFVDALLSEFEKARR